MDKLLSVALKLSGAPKLGANEISKGDSDLTPSKVQLGNGYALDCITPEVMQQMKEETATLTADNEQLRSLLRQAQEQIDSLKAEAENLQVERQQVQEVLKEILENNKNKLKGYLSNAFGQGIKDIRNLLHSTWE
jgi:TolA-binding protein